MTYPKQASLVILRRRQVQERTGLSTGVLYRQMGAGLFPMSVPLGGTTVGWVESEVDEWIASRLKKRDEGRAKPQASPAAPAIETRIAEVAKLVELMPDLMVQLEGMKKPMRLADALETIKAEAARDLEHARLVEVAAECRARNLK